ncbi:SRPBCC family protein [Promicromonospora kroppenstedtii]|uniref:SRPBCC family protein n=1 Tax=Promicromonospora kroppenstedtii TaxID=440482 RepID=A0ABW7XNE8_9MICO
MTCTSKPRRTARAAVALATTLGTAFAVTGCTGSHEDAAAPRASASAPESSSAEQPIAAGEQCAGTTINRSAPITSSADILIDAPVDQVWDVHTDVERWDDWQPTVLTIERLDDGPFTSDSQFEWTTPVPETAFSPADTMTVTSSVQQLEPGKCLLWEGPGTGESIRIDKGIHLWTFTETDEGTLVHTEESWDAELLAALDEADAKTAGEQLGGGLEVWLDLLKAEVEAS